MKDTKDIMERACGRIAVIGGGASGCMAAVAAAQAGCRVTLFDKNEKIAKKIYATGNGRCNLTNLFLDGSCYHTRAGAASSDSAGRADGNDAQECRDSAFRTDSAEGNDIARILSFIGRFSQEDLICFFRRAGVPVHDRDGYVYPRTDQAETIARALEKCMRQSDIRIRTSCAVLQIDKEPDIGGRGVFRIRYAFSGDEKAAEARRGRSAEKTGPVPGRKYRASRKDQKREAGPETAGRSRKADTCPPEETEESLFYCDAVILCTGGMAGISFGCSGDGYRFAEHFSHNVLPPLPALTRLVCGSPLLRRAAGVRCHASVTLLEDPAHDPAYTAMRPHGCEDGELQITGSGISGIPVFQISGKAAELLAEGRRVFVRIDFVPEFTPEEFDKETESRLRQDRGQMLADFLLGLAHRRVIDLVLAQAGLQAEMKARRFSDEELRALLQRFRNFELEVNGTGGFDHAQVTSGGVPLAETDDSFASEKCGGLYLAGELMDVDGRCGGYNLQWAMTSGVLAGRAAGRYVRGK